jgi:hypothetical protein
VAKFILGGGKILEPVVVGRVAVLDTGKGDDRQMGIQEIP